MKPITFGDVLSGCLLENENIVVTQKNDKFVLLEINTPSTEKRKESAEDAKRAVITDLSGKFLKLFSSKKKDVPSIRKIQNTFPQTPYTYTFSHNPHLQKTPFSTK